MTLFDGQGPPEFISTAFFNFTIWLNLHIF